MEFKKWKRGKRSNTLRGVGIDKGLANFFGRKGVEMSGQSKLFKGIAIVAGLGTIAAGAIGLAAVAGVSGAVSIVGALGLTHYEGYIGDETFDLGKPEDLGDIDDIDIGGYAGIREVPDDPVLPVSAALAGVGAITVGAAASSGSSGYSGRSSSSNESYRAKVDSSRNMTLPKNQNQAALH